MRAFDTEEAALDWASLQSDSIPAMKSARPYANPEAAARKLIEIANAIEAVQDGRIHIDLLNGPMLFFLATVRFPGLLFLRWAQAHYEPRTAPKLDAVLVQQPLCPIDCRFIVFKATPAEYSAGLKFAIESGWLVIHESGTYVKFTQVGAELFA
jgi:hypothetical protein